MRSRQATQALLAYATEKFACPEKVGETSRSAAFIDGLR